MKENRATKEEVWEVLNGRGYEVGGSTSPLETPGNSPPKISWKKNTWTISSANRELAQFEFPWGSRVHAETTKMQDLEFLTKVHGTDSSSFPSQYEEALQDKEERARAELQPGLSVLPRPLPVLRPSPAAPLTPREARDSLLVHCVTRQLVPTEFTPETELKGTPCICLCVLILYV